MKGQVYIINHKKGLIGIFTESNQFSVAEVLEMSLPRIGDLVIGGIESLGERTLSNITKIEDMNVFIQDIYLDQREAFKQLEVYDYNKNDWELI